MVIATLTVVLIVFNSDKGFALMPKSLGGIVGWLVSTVVVVVVGLWIVNRVAFLKTLTGGN